MYGTENVPFKVWVSQTHLHEKTPHKSHAYAVHIQCHGFSLISRYGPSLYECPRAIFIEKLFVSWLMLYIHTHGFHLLCLPPSHFNSSILKSITWSRVIQWCVHCSCNNIHTSFSYSVSPFCSFHHCNYKIHFFFLSLLRKVCKETREYSQLFLVSPEL